MKYVFYYDEVFHDRKITIKDNELNVLRSNGFDNYIGCFCGFQQKDLLNVIDELSNFELKYRQKFGISKESELKSTVVSEKHYKYGLKSFNKLDYEFYTDYFTLLNKLNTIIQINVLNKVEFLIHRLILNTNSNFWYGFNLKSFIYSFTKFFVIYGNKDLFNSFSNVKDKNTALNFKNELLRNIDIVIDNITGISRKKKELSAFIEMRIIITSFDFESVIYENMNFVYEPNFGGLCKLLNELEISPKEVKITIDNEENVFNASKHYKFGITKQADSKNVIQLRFVDILCGFIGRMMRAITIDESRQEDSIEYISDIEKNDLSTLRIISESWFDINEKIFNFYLLVYDALIVRHEYYWTTMTMIYGDDVIAFYSLLRYFAIYDNYENYKKVKFEDHRKYYNSMCIEELSNYYKGFEQM